MGSYIDGNAQNICDLKRIEQLENIAGYNMKKYQFNKTAMLQIERDLKVRVRALPVLEAKESALRLELKKLSTRIQILEQELDHVLNKFSSMNRLWTEMPGLVSVDKVVMTQRLVAGIRVPNIQRIEFARENYSLFSLPSWIPGGIEILKDIIAKRLNIHIQKNILVQMEIARRKTTQKVNLYKKVQIPEFEEAMHKIKRFLEDEENLSKSSQKILKSRLAA
ncbi:MAG: V-type ATP synthase subunit D [bacterium]